MIIKFFLLLVDFVKEHDFDPDLELGPESPVKVDTFPKKIFSDSTHWFAIYSCVKAATISCCTADCDIFERL